MGSQIFGKFFLGMASEENREVTEEECRNLDQGRGYGIYSGLQMSHDMTIKKTFTAVS